MIGKKSILLRRRSNDALKAIEKGHGQYEQNRAKQGYEVIKSGEDMYLVVYVVVLFINSGNMDKTDFLKLIRRKRSIQTVKTVRTNKYVVQVRDFSHRYNELRM